MKKQLSGKSENPNPWAVKGVYKNVKSLLKERLGEDLLSILQTIEPQLLYIMVQYQL